MKKKSLLTLLTILFVAATIGYYAFVNYFVNSVEIYAPYTFSTVLDYDSMRTMFGIGPNEHPRDYGYDNVEEFDFYSIQDSVRLNTWHIPSAPASDRCLVLVHGRTSNRLKPMKYVALTKKYGYDSLMNICIPDLRNSGKSEAAKTFMGSKFSEDLASTLLMLNSKYGYSKFILYGFSMGAMATSTLFIRDDLEELLQSRNIEVMGVLFDSPLVNVKSELQYNTNAMSIPDFLFRGGYNHFCKDVGPYCNKLSLTNALESYDGPILILQSKDDTITPFYILEDELQKIGDRSNLQLKLFEGSEHVEIYQDSSNHQEYVRTVADFLNSLSY